MQLHLRELGGRFERLNLLRRIMLHKHASHIGLHFGQLPVLEYIINNDCCTQKEIADKMKVTPASIALSTKRLQKAGLLQKKIDQDNLRCKALSVTPKGIELAEKCRQAFDQVDACMFDGFSEIELLQMKDLLDRLIQNLNSELFENEDEMHSIAALIKQVEKHHKNMRGFKNND